MRKVLIFALVLSLIAVGVVMAEAGGRPLHASLTGAAEVPAGDPDGSGSAHITLNQGQGVVCFDIEVSNIGPVVNAHIHIGAAGSNGRVVVGFNPAVNGLSNCVSDVSAELIKDIRQNPEGYYVNVHTAEFPGGAVRGQLSR